MAASRTTKQPDPVDVILSFLVQLRAELDFALEEIYRQRLELHGLPVDDEPARPRFEVLDGGRDDLNP